MSKIILNFYSNMTFVICTFLISALSATAADTFSVTPFAFSSAGGTISAGPYTCTTSIGSVEGSATSKNGNLKFTGGFICVAPYVHQACDSDLDGNGSVDSADLGVMLVVWGPVIPAFKFADLNRDGIIDSADLGVLLTDIGTTCSSGLVGPSIEIEFVEPEQPVEIQPQTHRRNSK
jgi:hypothetical protein